MIEKTLGIIKPHAVKEQLSGEIIKLIELNGFTIARMEKKRLTKKEAETFYEVHKEKPFFGELITNITAGPLILMVLEKENCITEWRNLMGATDPKNAAPGTIRKLYGLTIDLNAVHGSDAPETAKTEIRLFFPEIPEISL